MNRIFFISFDCLFIFFILFILFYALNYWKNRTFWALATTTITRTKRSEITTTATTPVITDITVAVITTTTPTTADRREAPNPITNSPQPNTITTTTTTTTTTITRALRGQVRGRRRCSIAGAGAGVRNRPGFRPGNPLTPKWGKSSTLWAGSRNRRRVWTGLIPSGNSCPDSRRWSGIPPVVIKWRNIPPRRLIRLICLRNRLWR